MAKDTHIGEILKNEEIKRNYFLMQMALPGSFAEPLPGQFVMVRIAGLSQPFLGRPLSVYSFARRQSRATLELLYRVVGQGTAIMAGLIKGSQIEVHGPLGGSYELFPEKKNIVFIAGGIGVAPLSLFAQYLCKKVSFPSAKMTFYLGAQTANAVVGLDKISSLSCDVKVCTDDGTLGKKSSVVHAFQKDIKKYDHADTAIYACGPRAMLKALAGILRGSRFSCQVSLEERMACGTGACMGCAVGVKDETGEFAYKRVCKDGPVFNLYDINW